MIDNIKVDNFGPIKKLAWCGTGAINLIIGPNGSGKSFFLKALYTSIRAIEAYRRGNDNREMSQILSDKLYWVFQPDKIGELVSKSQDDPLRISLDINQKSFLYSFGKDTTKLIGTIENHCDQRTSNSILLPAKEVLSLYTIILKSRDQDMLFGFDDTYLDLARALQTPPQRGRQFREFSNARANLESLLGGRVYYDDSAKKWFFKKGNIRFPMGVTAEGIKKIAILDTLLSNRFIDCGSVIFIDEPESALHPMALATFLDIVQMLATRGIQFFIASHSYFVIKKLFLIAQASKTSLPIQSIENDCWVGSDLRDGMPENPIISESIRLYEEEISLVLE